MREHIQRPPELQTPPEAEQVEPDNQVVPAALHDGIPLPPALRLEMERRFGVDLSRVRLHTDAEAARQVNASAFTAGEHIVAAQHTPALLRHELAHVIQQRRAVVLAGISRPHDAGEHHADHPHTAAPGAVPAVQRLTPEEERQRQLDEFRATMARATHAGYQRSTVPVLLDTGAGLHQRFYETTEDQPRTREALAEALVQTYTELQERVGQAPRADDGALLYQDISGMRPWTESRMDSLDDLEWLSDANIADYMEYGGGVLLEREEDRPRSRQRVEPPPMPDGSPAELTEGELDRLREPGMHATSGPRAQAPTRSERWALGETGGGPEIRAGIAALENTHVAEAVEAVSTRIREVNADNPEFGEQPAISIANAQANLLQTTGALWYITSRIYSLDRTGHIARDDYEFNLEWVAAEPGTYYLAFYQINAGSAGTHTWPIVLRLDGGPARVDEIEFSGQSFLQDWVPLLNQGRSSLNQHRGIGIIVSQSVPAAGEQFQPEGDLDRVVQAARLAPSYMQWAMLNEMADIADNPGDAVLGELTSLGIEKLGQMLPPVALGAMGIEVLRFAAWLGRTASIATFGNEDEIDIAAQAIARRVAEWVIDQVIDAGVGLSGRAVSGGVRRLRGGGVPEVETPDVETAPVRPTEPETPDVETAPVRPAESETPDVEAAPPVRVLPPPIEVSDTRRSREPDVEQHPDTPDDFAEHRRRFAERRRRAETERQQRESESAETREAEQRQQEREAADEAERQRLEEAGADPDVVRSLDIHRRRREAEAEEAAEVEQVEEPMQRTGTDDEVPQMADQPRASAGSSSPPPPPRSRGSSTTTTAPARGATAPPGRSRRAASERQDVDAPPEPQLSDSSASLEDRLEFMHQHRHLLGPQQQQELDRLRAQVQAGERTTARGHAVRRWETRIDRSLREQYAQQLSDAYGFPVTSTGRRPDTPAGDMERRLEEVETGRPADLSMTARTRDGEVVQIDGYNQDEGVPREVKNYQQPLSPEMHRPSDDPRPRWMQQRDREEVYEPDVVDEMQRTERAATGETERRMEETFEETIHDMRDQMRRQAQFALDYGFPYFEWRVPRAFMDDFDMLVRQHLPRPLRDVIRIRPLEEVVPVE
jgi:hypothetical protein